MRSNIHYNIEHVCGVHYKGIKEIIKRNHSVNTVGDHYRIWVLQ